MATFSNLFEYNSSTGTVIPQTSSIKAAVEDTIREIFAPEEVSLDETTALGRLVEAITLLFVNVCGVNAQNANGLNPNSAIGEMLDALGALFNVVRLLGESDDDYRKRMLASISRGSGFPQSIRNAIGGVAGVTSVLVLENGNEDPAVLPTSENGVVVPGHSIFVCVDGTYNDNNVAAAIYSTKSAGCGYTTTDEYGTVASGTKKVVQIADDNTGSTNTVVFYKPTVKNIRIEVDVASVGYTGDSIADDASAAISRYVSTGLSGKTLTKPEVISAIANGATGIYAKAVRLFIGQTVANEIVIAPNETVAGGATIVANSVGL